MKSLETRLKVVTAVLLLAALPSFAAGPKRRAVKHPSPGAAFSATIKGTVVDATSNLPVAFATIQVLNTKVTATREGTFEINNVNGFGTNVPVTASRSGYTTGTLTVTGSGTHTLNFRLQSHPVVTVRMVDGTSYQLDDDSVKFGYVILFGGYVSTSSQQFCKSDGTRQTVEVPQFKKILGPAILVRTPSCCSREDQQLQRVNVTLQNGETGDWTFKESCDGYQVDLLGRNHITGDQLYLKFSEIAEVTFP